MGYMFDHGKFVDERLLSVSVKNKGLNYGLGCLEGIRAYWNPDRKQLYVFRLDDHMRRLHASAKSLYMTLPFSVSQLNEITIQLLLKNQISSDVYIRPLCFNGLSTLRPYLHDSPYRLSIYLEQINYQPKPALRTCISSWTRMGSNMIPPQTKSTAGYLNSALAITEANINGYDEAIFINSDGNVSEGATENIFIVRGDVVITPPIADEILPGITRATVAQIIVDDLGLTMIEQSITRVEVYNAEEVFFTGTAIGIKPVVEVDQRVIGAGSPGSVTRMIQQIYNRVARGDHPQYFHYCTPVYK